MAPHTEQMDHSTTDLTKPAAERTATAGRTPLVIKLLVAATFVVILNETIMINAIPRLMADFHVDARAAQWLSTVFMLTMAAVIPVTGWFLQRVTTRTAYAVAMATFSAGTALAAIAPTFEVLLAARVVQAGGTAVMMPLLMTTLMTVVPESDRGRVMGQVTLAMSCAPALGPAVSGVILHLGSWRLIFVFVLPIAVLVGIAGLRQLENVGETENTPVSWVSVALAAGGFGSLVYGLSEIGTGEWTGPVLTVLAGVLLIAAFAAYQVRLQGREMPLLDLRALRHRTFTVSLLLMTAGFMAFLGSMILLPLYLQELRGLSELQTGLLVMPGGLAMGLLGPQVGKLYDRVGARPVVIPGAIGMVLALAALGRIGATTPYAVVVALHIALMVSLAAVFTPVFTVGLGDLPEHLYSHGSSLLGTLQQVAGAIGTAALIVVMSNRTTQLAEAGAPQPEAYVGGLEWAFTAAALMGAVVVIASLFLPAKADGAAPSTPVH
ncbi:MFS transporter [Tsukamurella pulmonis]|uniref:MDR family MFS transporter n=1 Tax=Tsukamurella pulmonis TaxID=47312 RepID=UPI000791A99C|nr:MDR family MFS transporter [Tsukamurella pulmonis]KXP11012.1 MFS transporter [Tsukamurella pulmonis]RDH11225.1 MFS transporter [Tsukamurella pulmonis]